MYGILYTNDDFTFNKDFCPWRCDICMLTIDSLPISFHLVSSLLVTGRPGAGKTSIVKAVSKRLQENPKTFACTSALLCGYLIPTVLSRCPLRRRHALCGQARQHGEGSIQILV